jgi:hypothetical protein
MTDIDVFLATRTAYCARLDAKITPVQCDLNAKSGKVFSCSGCNGLNPLAMTTIGAPMSRQTTKCGKCKQTLKIVARGMCGSCYASTLKAEKLAALETVDRTETDTPVDESVPEETVEALTVVELPTDASDDLPGESCIVPSELLSGLLELTEEVPEAVIGFEAERINPLLYCLQYDESHPWLVQIPEVLSAKLDDLGATHEDIFTMLEMLLAGQLQQVRPVVGA